MSQCISIRFAFTFYFCHRWWRPRFPTERRWSCSGRRRKRRRRSSGRRTASRSTVVNFVPSFSQFKICFFYEKSPLPPLWLLLGSPMLMDPHHSQQYACLKHTVWRLQQEVTRLKFVVYAIFQQLYRKKLVDLRGFWTQTVVAGGKHADH